MKIIYNKLVRDNIPDIIEADDKKYRTKILNDQDYISELKKKLCEEANEVNQAMNREEIIEELSDIIEIVETLKNIYDIQTDEIEEVRKTKVNKNGKFDKKIFLEFVEEKNE